MSNATDRKIDHKGQHTVTSDARSDAPLSPRIHRQSQIYQAITGVQCEQELFPLVCQIAIDLGGASMAWVGVANPDSQLIKPVASAGIGTDYLNNIHISTRADQPEGCGPSATAYRNNQPVISYDWARDPLTAPWRKIPDTITWGSSGCFPIQRQGQPIGVLSVYHLDVGFFNQSVSQLFHEISQDISSALDSFEREQQQRKVLETLRNNEQHFRAYFERSMVGMCASGPNKKWLEVNPALCEMLGYSAAELESMSWDMLTHPEDLDPDSTFFQQLIDGTLDEFALDKRFIKKSGKTIDAHLSVRAIRDTEGEFSYAVAVIEDITQRKMVQRLEYMRQVTLEKTAKGSSFDDIMLYVIDSSEALYPGSMCSILLLDEEGKRLFTRAAPSLPSFFSEGIDGFSIGMGVGSCGTAAYTGERVIVEDISSHPYWEISKNFAAKAGLASCWSEPILSTTGKVLGTFAIYRDAPSRPDTQEIALIESAANLLGIALDRARAEEELLLASSIYTHMSEGVLVSDAEHRVIACNPAFVEITGYSLDDMRAKKPSFLHSDRNKPGLLKSMGDSLKQYGHWQGEIWNRHKNGEIYLIWITVNAIYNDKGEVQRYISVGSDITNQARSDELIWRQANYDFLTDLPNRHMFQDRLKQELRKSLREKTLLALLFIDLDHFKDVNDSLGHPVGDKLLIQVARRIKSCVKETDTIARLGGDEFAAILPKLNATCDAEQAAERIISALAEPYRINNETIYAGASIGIALCPNDTTDLDLLISNAEQAMYASKALGRNRLSYFTQSLHDEARNRLQLINDMRSALELQQFELHYQPITELATGNIHKAEALIRWRHPERGMISPAEFIPLAEETGLIVEIGDWVFREAAFTAKRWRDLFNAPVQISLNMSPMQFQSDKLSITDWLTYLQHIKLSPKLLCIEITEGLLLNASNDVKNKLRRFREAGIEVAIDDFGVGYSALSYLRHLDIDVLKIDQSFIHNLDTEDNDLVLTEAIVVMAQKLGLKVTAEGIETHAQRHLLLGTGCDYGQGYLFSRPLPMTAFEDFFFASDGSTNTP